MHISLLKHGLKKQMIQFKRTQSSVSIQHILLQTTAPSSGENKTIVTLDHDIHKHGKKVTQSKQRAL